MKVSWWTKNCPCVSFFCRESGNFSTDWKEMQNIEGDIILLVSFKWLCAMKLLLALSDHIYFSLWWNMSVLYKALLNKIIVGHIIWNKMVRKGKWVQDNSVQPLHCCQLTTTKLSLSTHSHQVATYHGWQEEKLDGRASKHELGASHLPCHWDEGAGSNNGGGRNGQQGGSGPWGHPFSQETF